MEAPTDLRSMFEMFRFYRPDVGFLRLLENHTVDDLTPRQIYHAAHGRPPDSLSVAVRHKEFDATAMFAAAISSHEFQSNLASNLLLAFPEKRRLFFVHIPKTAGVDLATRFICRYPSINTNLLDRTLTSSSDALFLAIKHVVLEMECSDTVFISGHTHLNVYQFWAGNGVRANDKVFTVVREPMERIISQINYVLGRIFTEESPMPPDADGWRNLFGVDDLSKKDSRDYLVSLSSRILRDPGVVVPEIMCTYIGGATCEEALTKTVAHDLEVIELKRLDAWTEEKLGVTKATRLNPSERFIGPSDLTPDDVGYARSIAQEDYRYYEMVISALKRLGKNSLTGSEILN